MAEAFLPNPAMNVGFAAIVSPEEAALPQPLAILHGEAEQLVNLAYLQKLTVPTLWRGSVQVIPAVGHALHLEVPETFTALLEEFISDLT